MSLKEAALAYARAGIPVFPCQPGSKRPLAGSQGFKDATTDEAQIDRWWTEDPNRNIAFTPHTLGWCVVDLDPPDGVSNWTALNAALGDGALNRTWTVQTPRGGRHLYFEGELPTSVGKLGTHIDTRGRGSYALLAPSCTADGTYTIVRDAPIAPLPAWVPLRIAERTVAAKEARDASDIPLDLPINLAKAEAFLKSRDEAVEGFGADDICYHTAAALRDMLISEEAALNLMLAHFKVSPWKESTADWIAFKTRNAFAYAQNEPGSRAGGKTQVAMQRLLAAGWKSPEPEAEPEPVSVPIDGPVPLGGLLTRAVTPVQELVAGFVERGLMTILAGSGGTHKSRLALQWGVCLHSGTPIFGRTTQQATFVYLSYEDHADEVTRRTQAICRRLQVPEAKLAGALYWDLRRGQPLFTVTEDGIEPTEFLADVRTRLQAIPGHKFVVADSAYNVLDFRGQAKINEPSVKGAINAMDRLCEECDCTIVMLWHPSQAGDDRGDAGGWSVAWHNVPRAKLQIRKLTGKDAPPDAYSLSVVKRNNAPVGPGVTLRWNDGALLPLASSDLIDADQRFHDACLAAALSAYRTNQPINVRTKFPGFVIKDIEKQAGRRPTWPELEAALNRWVDEGRLRYHQGKSHDIAGYYPQDAAILMKSTNGDIKAKGSERLSN